MLALKILGYLIMGLIVAKILFIFMFDREARYPDDFYGLGLFVLIWPAVVAVGAIVGLLYSFGWLVQWRPNWRRWFT